MKSSLNLRTRFFSLTSLIILGLFLSSCGKDDILEESSASPLKLMYFEADKEATLAIYAYQYLLRNTQGRKSEITKCPKSDFDECMQNSDVDIFIGVLQDSEGLEDLGPIYSKSNAHKFANSALLKDAKNEHQLLKQMSFRARKVEKAIRGFESKHNSNWDIAVLDFINSSKLQWEKWLGNTEKMFLIKALNPHLK